MLNPNLSIPWILLTPISGIIAYIALNTGFVSLTFGVIVPWTTPAVINGFLTSGISTSMLQILIIVLAFAFYYPFIRIYEKGLTKS